MTAFQEEASIMLEAVTRYARKEMGKTIKSIADDGADEMHLALALELTRPIFRAVARARKVLGEADEAYSAADDPEAGEDEEVHDGA